MRPRAGWGDVDAAWGIVERAGRVALRDVVDEVTLLSFIFARWEMSLLKVDCLGMPIMNASPVKGACV